MISFEEAQKIVLERTPMAAKTMISLDEALHYVLAEDVISPTNDPPFDKSAMDGYALGEGDLSSGSVFRVVGALAAGDPPPSEVPAACCYRIFTGAAAPLNTQAIAQQEHVRREGETIVLEEDQHPGRHIRRKGEQVQKGEIALPKGTPLRPGALGFLKGLGLEHVPVYSKPTVGVLITGSEFAQDISDLEQGKIFNSNGPMLGGLLTDLRLEHEIRSAADDPDLLRSELQYLADRHQLILITGGVSVGDHDHSPTVISDIGFETYFHRVKQKPGKPLLLAGREGQLLFGLPGNPLSVYVGFHLYVRPTIGRITDPDHQPTSGSAPMAHEVRNKADRKEFALARLLKDGRIKLSQMRASHMLIGLAEANVLAILNPGMEWKENDIIEYIPLS